MQMGLFVPPALPLLAGQLTTRQVNAPCRESHAPLSYPLQITRRQSPKPFNLMQMKGIPNPLKQ